MRKRVLGLDWLRAVSMILVVLYHYTTRYQESIGHVDVWPVAVPWGCYAVNTFFILTGYLTFANLHRGGDFLKKRIVRLYPTFWVSILITSAFMALLMPERLRSGRDILLNFTMFPGLLGAQSVDGVYWTLQVEMIFYLLVSVISISSSEQRRKIGVAFWIAAGAAAFFCRKAGIDSLLVKLMGLVTLADHRFEFLAGGALLALLERDEHSHPFPIYAGLILCGIIAYMDMGWIHGVLWMAFTFACILLAVKMDFGQDGKSSVVTKLLDWLARISYPVYLIHQFIGFAILRKLDVFGMTSEIFILIPIALSLLLGTLLHKYVELPTAKLWNKIIRET